MIACRRIVSIATLLSLAAVAAAQESGKDKAAEAERVLNEKRLSEQLDDVVFVGEWRMVAMDASEADQELLSKPRPERYGIKRAVRVSDEYWIITARIQYANHDVELPIRVRILWAGNTPVITLDNVNIPMLGEYSARVVIHEGFYSGTWSGSGYGGVMGGQILSRKAADRLAPETPEDNDQAPGSPAAEKSGQGR